MPKNPNPAAPKMNSRKKNKIQPNDSFKKVRSKIPRGKRIPLFPILEGSLNHLLGAREKDFPRFPAPSCSSTCLPGEISPSESSFISVGSENLKKLIRSNDNVAVRLSEVEFGPDAIESERRITRSYYKKRKTANSQPSVVESVSEMVSRDFSKSDDFPQSNLKQGTVSAKEASAAKENEGKADSTAISSDISCIEPHFGEISKPKAVSYKGDGKSLQIQGNAASSTGFSELSCLESLSVEKIQKTDQNAVKTEPDFAVSEQTVDLACSEQFSNGTDGSYYSSLEEMMVSDLELETFHRNSESMDFTIDSISSVLDESSDDFSEQSNRESTKSACFSLFLQYLKQFSSSRTCSDLESRASHGNEEDFPNYFTLLRFEDEEHEESYKRFRNRERRQIFSKTEYGDLVLQQRQVMVNWIVEHSEVQELQYETLFLSVNLLDRFLGRGFFKNKRNLQLVGIACCTLATRIEENQPLNYVWQKTFQVKSNIYSRCEVVAMEWLVQEVLDFQCFMPTTYNFLWFYLKAARVDAVVENRTKSLAVLSLMDPHSLCFWPSTVAACLVILAALSANRDSSCKYVMETHVRTKNDDLPECIQSLEWLVKYVC